MLKITRSSDKPALSKNNGSKSVFSGNNNSKLAFAKNNSNSKIDEFGISKNNMEYAKKSKKLSKLNKSKNKKLSKSKKSKSEKTFKSQNSAKPGKKLSKSENLTSFDATKDGPKVLTSDAQITFCRL